MRKAFIVASMVAVLGITLTPRANADDVGSVRPLDKSTVLTFSEPVSLPSVTLPAGSYLFHFVDAAVLGPTVLQVMDKDGKVAYATLFTIPIVRTNSDRTSQISFKETKEGAPLQVGAWFFDDTAGCELIYTETK